MPQEKRKDFYIPQLPSPSDTSAIDTGMPIDPTVLPPVTSKIPQIDWTKATIKPLTMVEKPGTLGTIVSTIAPVIDVLSRGQYASAKFFDGLSDENKNIFEVVSEAFREGIDPKQRLSFSDLIKKNAPVWAKDNPKSTAVLGFILDVGLDPTTYLGVGLAKTGIKVGGQTLSKVGMGAFKETIEAYSKKVLPVAVADSLPVIEARVAKQVASEGFTGKFATAEIKKRSKEEFAEQAKKLDTARAKANSLDTPSITGETTKAELKKKTIPLADVMEGQLKDLDVQFGKGNPWIKFRGKINETVLDELGLGLKGFDEGQAIMRKLTADEVYETAEKRIASLVELAPGTEFKLFEKPGLRLKVGVPFGKQYDIPGTQQLFQAIGVNKLFDKIQALKGVTVVKQLGGLVSRRFGLEATVGVKAAEEFGKAITKIENSFDSSADSVVRAVIDLKFVSEESRERIGKAMTEIDDLTTKTVESLSRINRNITQKTADAIVQRTLAKAKLDPQEMSIVANLQQGYKDMMLLEKEADLLKHEVINYNPRIYDLMENPTEFNFVYRQKGVALGKKFTPGLERKFKTLKEAEAAGFEPILDAAILYANRMLQSKRALAVKQFNDTLGTIFNIKDFSTKNPVTFSQLPAIVQKDIRLLGDAVYPVGVDEQTKWWMKAVDKGNTTFRQLATVAKPSFAPRQLIGNTIQAALILGVKAFKTFDPRAGLDASLLFMDRGKPTKNLPEFITNFFNKFVGPGESGADAVFAQRIALGKITGEERVRDYASQYATRNTFGQQISGEDILKEVRDNAVVRGQDFLGEPFNTSLNRELQYNSNSLKSVAKKFATGEIKFFGKDVILPLPWVRLPSIIEDYGRVMAYINGRRMGYSPAEATKLVNKTYFDYSRGLAGFERNVIRRFLPFYTYQRFAIPLVLQSAITKPGIPAATDKFIKTIDKLINSENPEDTLTEAEREIFGKSFIIENPRIFRGFDKDGKIKFNIFNNMTPLDTLGFFVTDRRTGELDVKRTVEKSILAMLTPYVKLPVEQLFDKQFFTNRTIEEASRLGDLSQSTMSAVLPESIKALMGWENRVDRRTGKTTTYVNPWLAHYSLGFIPPLRNFVDAQESHKTPLDKALKVFLGVQTQTLDLREQQIWQNIMENKEMNELSLNVRKSYSRGALSTYERSLQDYRDLIKITQESRQRQNIGGIRGKGIVPAVPQPIPAAEQEEARR